MLTTPFARRWLGAGAALLLGLGAGCSHQCHDQACSACNNSCASAPLSPAHAPGGYCGVAPVPGSRYSPLSNDRFAGAQPELPSQIVVSEKPNFEALKPFEHPVLPHRDDRRSYPDITAKPEFTHAADYSALVGELHYSPAKDQWRVRYASIDEEDRYGGSVTLQGGTVALKQMHTGMMVRVQGRLIDPESRDVSPTYSVRDIEPLSK
jgi:hypothetical protein